MHWHIIRVLLHKEILRHLANRGGLVLALLLVGATMLMSYFRKDSGQDGILGGGLEGCFVDYWQEDAWVSHLRDNVPDELRRQIRFRHVSQAAVSNELLAYPIGSGAIQMRTRIADDGSTATKVWFWHPDSEGRALAPYEAWFWRESSRYFQQQVVTEQRNNPVRSATSPGGISNVQGQFEYEHTQLKGPFEMRVSITTSLVLFAVFFACVYQLPLVMCEERERGILFAQALSPASAWDIFAAKFLFYPVIGIALGALLAGIAKPAVLASVFFWLVLIVMSAGLLGIGLTIASLAKTQRAASLGALCYMFVVALFMFGCQQGEIPGLPSLALEYHCPRMLYAALSDTVTWAHWGHLMAATVLAVGWNTLARHLFCKYGWQ